MSYLTDALRLLDEEAVALAFLPAINYAYLFWWLRDPSWQAYGITGFAVFISAAVYNSYAHVDFGSFERSSYGEVELVEDDQGKQVKKQGKGDIVDGWSLVVVGLISVLWLLVFLGSLLDLAKILEAQSVWPTVLVTVSVLVVCLVITELAFSRWLPLYRRNSRDEPDFPDANIFKDQNAGVVIYTIRPSKDSELVTAAIPIEETELDSDEVKKLSLGKE
ncbi:MULTISPECIES: hypothetical protein [Haloferax]|uniref:Uncharacterized protein n=1 Tax=Haloferax lucentense (strain DSM 14919 / JCM 9276 / NCIMB 13854 / Aa 2.2) TaxID=1230452 RepID=M0H138_HALL2|nr:MULTISPECIES: hypothetical protein [Haloferax]ELZ77467.1 hypothetical protein C456_02981 [Haloferax lucentense DSM 14919]